MADKQVDLAVAALANTLNKIDHPGGSELRLVMFDGAPDSVKKQVAEAIVHFLRRNKFMPYPEAPAKRRRR